MDYLIACGFLLAAMLYASVGHGGASGYLALMALLQFPPAQARPLALLMNIAVAAVAAWHYRQYFRPRLFMSLGLIAIPMAYWGGTHKLSEQSYALLLGSTLVFAALWLLFGRIESHEQRTLPVPLALITGASLGLLAGLTGIGGGVFLSPLLILGRFANAKQTAAVSAVFILLNSIAGLSAQWQSLQLLPAAAPLWVVAALLGGLIGARIGAIRFDDRWLRRLLALVLLIASAHLLQKAWALA